MVAVGAVEAGALDGEGGDETFAAGGVAMFGAG